MRVLVDAVLVADSVKAVSQGDFSSSSNATKLVFKTGADLKKNLQWIAIMTFGINTDGKIYFLV